jgi:hypothetical protein
MRVESDRPVQKGGWLHGRGEEFAAAELPQKPEPISDDELERKWSPVADMARARGIGKLPDLAEQLGVSIYPLVALGVGYGEVQGRNCWTFPEKNARGQVINILRRMADGKKLSCKGARRGLIYSDVSFYGRGPVWIVEGSSDTAAGLTLGMCVVGRPNNAGGATMLAELLEPHRRRKIIVLGEHDRKPPLAVRQKHPTHSDNCNGCDKCWPGLHGAQVVSRQLTIFLNRQVGYMLPPSGIKDLREYINRIPCMEWPRYATQIRRGKLPSPGAQDR